MKEAGIVQIMTSILWRQNTVAQFIATRPILGLCEVAERRTGTRVTRRWWEQTEIDWKASREKAQKSYALIVGPLIDDDMVRLCKAILTII